MKKLILISFSVYLGGCVAYTDNYPRGYKTYGQVTNESIIVAPSYIKNQDGSIESAPSGSIYFGRTAPEPMYVTPYNRQYMQPQYRPSQPQIKK